jgi:hypothetical protein
MVSAIRLPIPRALLLAFLFSSEAVTFHINHKHLKMRFTQILSMLIQTLYQTQRSPKNSQLLKYNRPFKTEINQDFRIPRRSFVSILPTGTISSTTISTTTTWLTLTTISQKSEKIKRTRKNPPKAAKRTRAALAGVARKSLRKKFCKARAAREWCQTQTKSPPSNQSRVTIYSRLTDLTTRPESLKLASGNPNNKIVLIFY